MELNNLPFYADLHLVKMRAQARGETAAVSELKQYFPQIFEKETAEKLEIYCKTRENILKTFGYDALKKMFEGYLEGSKH